GAGVEAALVTGAVPDRLGLAGHAIGLGAALPDLPGNRLAGRHRPAHRPGDVLVAGLHARAVLGAADLLDAGLVAGLADGAADLLVAGLVARLVAGLALLAVAGLADLLQDGLLHRLVAGDPALLQARVVDQLVAGLDLRLTGREAALGVAARLGATAVAAGAA